MKEILAIPAIALLASCAHAPTNDFVQGSIRITPPIKMDRIFPGIGIDRIPPGIVEDGGTSRGSFTDAKGRVFDLYIDRRFRTKTPDAIYLNAFPGERKSIRVKNEAEFKQKLGLE
jgi:hypothetical protein